MCPSARTKVSADMREHPKAPGAIVTAYLRNMDEHTRMRMMELVRGDPKHTVGEAPQRATTEPNHEWTTPQHVEEKREPATAEEKAVTWRVAVEAKVERPITFTAQSEPADHDHVSATG